jgi:hypothetical protein
MGIPEEQKPIHIVHCRECDGYHLLFPNRCGPIQLGRRTAGAAVPT